jgi:hypothetical protein
MNHWFPVQLHIDLNVTHSGPLLINIVLYLVMASVELQKVDGCCFIGLASQEFGHELNLLELAG